MRKRLDICLLITETWFLFRNIKVFATNMLHLPSNSTWFPNQVFLFYLAMSIPQGNVLCKL